MVYFDAFPGALRGIPPKTDQLRELVHYTRVLGVEIGISMGIPMDVGMGFVCGLGSIPTGSWEFYGDFFE